jgi:hypothetical protein
MLEMTIATLFAAFIVVAALGHVMLFKAMRKPSKHS